MHRTAKHTVLRKRQGLQVKAVVPLPLVAAAALAPLGWIALGGEKAAVTPLQALKLLTEDRQVLLVDIRSKEGRSSGGSPDLKAIKGTTVQIPYLVVNQGQIRVPPKYSEALSKNPRVKKETTLVLLDSFGKDSPKAARQATRIAKKVYYVAGGAEGAKGWKSSGLPWKDGAGFSFFGFGGRTKQREPELKSPRQAAAAAADKPSEGTQKIDKKPSQALESVTNAVGDTVSSGSSRPATSARRSTELSKNAGVLVAGGIIAVGGVAIAAAGVESVLELLGVLGIFQFGVQRLLYAQDRERTANDLRTLIDEKIALREAPGDLQRLTATLLDADWAAAEAVEQSVQQAVLSAGSQADRTADKAQSAVAQGRQEVQAKAEQATR